MLNAISIDDDLSCLQSIKNYCEKIEFISLKKSFSNPYEALDYLDKCGVDIILVNIDLLGYNKSEFLRKINQNTIVIFSTGIKSYALEAFNLDMIDFLLKPYCFERFVHSMEKIRHYYTYLHRRTKPTNPDIYLKSDFSILRIRLQNVLYIQSDRDHCIFFYEDNAPQSFRVSLRYLSSTLSKNEFIRIHRRYIVRIDKCTLIKSNSIFVRDYEINLGRSYKKNVQNVLQTLN